MPYSVTWKNYFDALGQLCANSGINNTMAFGRCVYPKYIYIYTLHLIHCISCGMFIDGGINYIILFRHLFGSVYDYIIACSIIDLYLFFSDKINKTFVERARI